jgi:hypothetical protein
MLFDERRREPTDSFPKTSSFKSAFLVTVESEDEERIQHQKTGLVVTLVEAAQGTEFSYWLFSMKTFPVAT